MNLTAPLKVMIVEDQIAIRQQLEDFFQHQYNVIIIGVCGTVNEAIKLMRTTQPDLLFLDTELPDGTGFDILEQITEKTRVIFLANHGEDALRAIHFGAIDYLLKPFNNQELINALRRVICAQPLLQEQIAITLQSFTTKEIPDSIALRGILIDEVKGDQLPSE
jgi:two-component system LytT family response regulator